MDFTEKVAESRGILQIYQPYRRGFGSLVIFAFLRVSLRLARRLRYTVLCAFSVFIVSKYEDFVKNSVAPKRDSPEEYGRNQIVDITKGWTSKVNNRKVTFNEN